MKRGLLLSLALILGLFSNVMVGDDQVAKIKPKPGIIQYEHGVGG
ncbi:hypothetical protein [Brevibacillus borstelensis]